MRIFFLIPMLLFLGIWLPAQTTCRQFDDSVAKGKQFLAQKAFDKALIQFQTAQVAARQCDLSEAKSKEPADLIKQVFTGLQKQRDDAIESINRAEIEKRKSMSRAYQAEIAEKMFREEKVAKEKALQTLDSLEKVNDSLTSSLNKTLAQTQLLVDKHRQMINLLYFYQGKFAMAVKQQNGSDKYGFMDKEGTIQIACKYDEAFPF